MRSMSKKPKGKKSTLGLPDAFLGHAFVGAVLVDHHAVSVVYESCKETQEGCHTQEGRHIYGDLSRHD